MSVQTDLEARVTSLRTVLNDSNTAIIGKGGMAAANLSSLPAAIAKLSGGSGTYQEKSVTPTGKEIVVVADSSYDALSKVTVAGDENLTAANIAKGISIYGVTGSHEGGATLSPITVTPTGERFTEYAEDGHGFSQVTVKGDVNLKSQNIAEGVEVYGVIGTLKVIASETFPAEYEQYRTIVENLYRENTGEEPPTDMMVLESNGDITFGYFLNSWNVTSYNPTTTDFCAVGWRRISYHKANDVWEFDDFSTEASTGSNFIKNIRYCTKNALFYNGEKIWPPFDEKGIIMSAAGYNIPGSSAIIEVNCPTMSANGELAE